MNKRPKNRGIYILAAAVVLAVAVLVCSLASGSNFLADALGVITTPIRSGINSLSNWVEGQYNYAFRYDALVEENEALKQRIAELEEAARVGQDAIEENQFLRELLELDQKHSDFVYELAHVTAQGSTNWASTLTLSKGSKDGVAAGNCVIDQYGYLVGIVDEVAYNWCSVITVIDPELEMGALIARTNSAAILEGDFSLMNRGKLKLSYLPESTHLISGDEVLTSGMGGVYPAGLKVGTIDEILTDPSGIGRYAVITPSIDLNELRQVVIIKQFDVEE